MPLLFKMQKTQVTFSLTLQNFQDMQKGTFHKTSEEYEEIGKIKIHV